MVVANDIRSRYEALSGAIAEIAARVRDIVRNRCSEGGYLFEDRVKTLESVAEKIESGRFSRWADLDDLYACRVIVPLPSDEQEIVAFLADRFEQVALRRRSASLKPPDVFRFDSTRFVGRLRAAQAGVEPGSAHLRDIRFEVQVQTVFDHAWAKATHSLVYKSEGSSWKEMRLAAQLKAIAETLDMLLLGFAKTSEYVADGQWPTVQDKEEILRVFRELTESGSFPSEVAPRDWTRFVDNVYRAFLAFEGLDPMHTLNHRLRHLPKYLDAIRSHVLELGPSRVPRSISLFQLVVGVLASTQPLVGAPEFGYHLPIPEEMSWLFGEGQLNLPGDRFRCD